MRFLRPPLTRYTDHYDVTRFNLVWNLCLVVVFLLLTVSIANIRNDNYSSLINLIEVGFGMLALFILWKTRRFEIVSILASVGTFILVSTAFFTITNVVHYTTPMWGLVNVLFAYFLLGYIWGNVLLFGHIVVLICYYLFRLESNLANLPPLDEQSILNFIIETCSVGLALGYLMYSFILANQHAERTVKQSNEELKIQNQIITTQNQEKEVMLKEIHHRVKNNLQVITSLLRLQSQELDEEHSGSFSEAINRVKSMALIHEKMYSSDLLSNFDLESYLTSLTNELIDTYAVKKPIHLDVHTEIDRIDPKSIVPLSLLFNELISNSIKHGFRDAADGKITVRMLDCDKAGYICLKYDDNGTWKEGSKKSFGLELIDTMSHQLDGEYSMSTSGEGTSYTFSIKALQQDVG